MQNRTNDATFNLHFLHRRRLCLQDGRISIIIIGSRDAVRNAYNQSLISNAEVWMEMIESRNLTSHTYNDETAKDIVQKICGIYEPLFENLMEVMETYE